MSDLVVTGGTPAFTTLDGFTAQVAQGQVARLWGYYRDANGAAVDPTTPLVDVVNPNGVEVVANAVPTRLGQGVYYYDFAIPGDAVPGLWLVHWSGTIAGAPDDDWTPFQVVAGGLNVGAVGAGTSPLTLTTIGPFSFNTLLPDADGVTWYLSDLAGWDSPDVNGAFFERPGQSGLYVGESTFGGRPMVASGVVVATTAAALARAREALIAAMDIDQPIRVQRNGPGNDATTATYADAWRADKVRIRQGGPLHFAFEAPITAPDHRRHAATLKRIEVTDATTRYIRNAGSTSSSPVLHVRGPTTNPLTVTKGAKVVRLNVALASTDLLVVDFARHLVTLNGVLRSDLVAATSQWFELDGDPHNLLTAAQADMEESSGWRLFSNATVEWWKGVAKRGRQALAIRSPASGYSAAGTGFSLPSLATFPVTPGATISGGFFMRAAGAYSRSVHARFIWATATGAYLSESAGPASLSDVGDWTQCVYSPVVPAGAALAHLAASIADAGAGDVHLVNEAFVRSGTSTLWTPGGGNLVTIAGLASGGQAWLSWREAWA